MSLLFIRWKKFISDFFDRNSQEYSDLTRLTWLIHTSLLPSSCQLDKNFTLIGDLAQVHMSRKIFLIFLHAGKGNGKGESSWQLSITFITLSFGLLLATASIAQSAERRTMDLRVSNGFVGSNPTRGNIFFSEIWS